jgi:hypothetical protein
MKLTNPIIIFAIWICIGIWAALEGYGKVVIFLIVTAISVVLLQLGIGWLLFRIGRHHDKPKNKKSN